MGSLHEVEAGVAHPHLRASAGPKQFRVAADRSALGQHLGGRTNCDVWYLQLADSVGLLGYLLTDSVNFDEMGQCIPN